MIHPAAMILGTVAEGATVGDRTIVGEGSLVCTGARLGSRVIVEEGVRIESGAVVGDWATLKQGCLVGERARVGERANIGREVRLGTGVTVGEGAYVDDQTAWTCSPLYIVGSKLPVFQPRKGFMQIACQSHEFAWWDQNGREFARQAGFSPVQVSEYFRYLQLFKELAQV